MTKYYIQVVDGLFGEVGHTYLGDENVVVPPGFTPCLNDQATVSYHVIFPEDMVREIPESQYERIYEYYISGDDPSEILMEVLESVGHSRQPMSPRENPQVQQAREYLENFKRAAFDLSELWFELSHHEIELAGLNDGYPFELSFDEYDFSGWGKIPKRTPLEEALLFLNTPKYTAMAESDMDELEVFKEVVKALSLRWTRAQTDEEEQEIDRLIENL